MLYRYYIGSNNITHKLEDKKAIEIISKNFKGFTIFKGLGYWQGEQEKNLIVEIETQELEKLMITARELCKALEQQAVGVAEVGKMEFISL